MLELQNPCAECGLKDLCISHHMSAQDEAVIARSIRPGRSMSNGSALFWQGDEFQGLFAVRSGAVKTVSCDAEGQERVRGFFLPGDLIGLDAMHSGIYPASAETLGEARFCHLPASAILGLMRDVPAFTQRIVGLMSRDLSQSLSLAGEYTADERMAAFLLDISDRMGRRTGRYDQITLEMSRADIANFLRLVPETVSRVLGRFGQKSWIRVQRREVSILERDALEHLASPLREVEGTSRSQSADGWLRVAA